MIARPTTAQLIDAVRDDLRTRVSPFVTDPMARLALDMSILVLGSASVRSANELAWMLEEAEAVEALARELVGRLPALAEPLAACPPTGLRDIGDVHARYERASELLARMAEAAYDAGDAEAIAAVMALFEQRRQTQNAITGGFQAVGRA